MDLLELGLLIKQIRLSRRLTQQEAAVAAGLHPRTVSDLERGAASDIGVRKLEVLLGVLGLELAVRSKGQGKTLDDLARGQRRETPESAVLGRRVRKRKGEADAA
jgi:transcriptional regulator with XRE-family HTH domain